MRERVNKGEGGPKIQKFCRHHEWMAPNLGCFEGRTGYRADGNSMISQLNCSTSYDFFIRQFGKIGKVKNAEEEEQFKCHFKELASARLPVRR